MIGGSGPDGCAAPPSLPLHRVRLSWKPPSVGDVFQYFVYRVTGDTVTPASVRVLVAAARSRAASSNRLLHDRRTRSFPNGVQFTYFVVAEFVDDDGNPLTPSPLSGASNFATITAVNDPPAANADAFSTPEDTPLTIANVLANDPDVDSYPGTPRSIVVGGPSHGTVALNADGTFVYTPVADYYGSDSFTYKANDGLWSPTTVPLSVDSPVTTVLITVTEVNDPPVAADDSKTTAEDTTLVFPASDLLTNDTAGPANENGQHLTVVSVEATETTHGQISLVEGSVRYQPDDNYNGPASFTYTVWDDGTTNGASDPRSVAATVKVTVTEVNDPPVPVDDQQEHGEGHVADLPFERPDRQRQRRTRQRRQSAVDGDGSRRNHSHSRRGIAREWSHHLRSCGGIRRVRRVRLHGRG